MGTKKAVHDGDCAPCRFVDVAKMKTIFEMCKKKARFLLKRAFYNTFCYGL